MPTVAKTSSKLAKLGDIATFTVSTSAIPVDTADSSGVLPTLGATFTDGTDGAYLVGESLTVSDPTIGSYTGDILGYSQPRNSNKVSVDAASFLSRMNMDLRAYPLSDYNSASVYIPLYSLEYWTQQCGIFMTKVPGDVLFYQSGYGHFGAFAKNITRPVRSTRNVVDSGGVNGTMSLRSGRVWTGFGTGFESKVTLPGPTSANPSGSYVPFRVPSNTLAPRLIFGAEIYLTGTGRTGDITWFLNGANGAKPAIRLKYDSEVGFLFQTAALPGGYTTRLTATLPKDVNYTVYISAARGTTAISAVMTILDESGAVVYSQSATPAVSVMGQMTLRSVRYYGALGGSGNEPTYGNTFMSLMADRPTAKFAVVKSLTPGYKSAKFLVGFDGNVWEHIKQYCSIFHLDVSYRSGQLTIGPRQRDITVGASLSELSTAIRARDQARSVEVVNQNHTPTGNTPTVLWKADSVYQVAVGEVQEFTVQTPHSILETSQPVCVSGISPYPYTVGAGQYVVTGSDGYIVSPTFWADQGGSITTDTTENEGEIKVTIKGPDFDSPRAPYRISEGDAGRPALYVTGLGILADPKTLKVSTGNGKAAKDVGTTLDSPFISNAALAYDAAARASRQFATPEVTATLAEPLLYDSPSKFGTYPAGSLIRLDGNIVRVVSASQQASNLTGSADQHNTIYQLSRSYGTGAKISDVKTYNAGKTIGQVNIKPLKVIK